MSKMSRKEYLDAMKLRYLNGNKEEKKKLLNEAEIMTKLHRKSLIRYFWRVVNSKVKNQTVQKRGPKSQYDYEPFKSILGALWLESGKMCSRNLESGMAEWLPSFEKIYGKPISTKVKTDLYKISHASMDRIIHPFRRKFGRGKCGTKPGTILRTSIPMRAEAWHADTPGYFEADTIAHCGSSLAGEFVWTLTLTDIYSQWTEIRPVWHKGSQEILSALRNIESSLAFKILAFDCDNGGEFINYSMIEYFSKRDNVVKFTRSRPYKKNDQAHVEQKNWSYARQLLYYDRIDNKEIMPKLRQICTNYSLLKNHFYPTKK
jgi:5S rRNA maturation endonuclease (ribonuclease M5)